MRVLLIEDNPGDARLVHELLKEARGNFTISVAEKLGQGLKLLFSQDVDVVLLDLNLPDRNGLVTLTELQTRFSHLPIVIMTSIDDEELAHQAVRLGAQDYLVKGNVNGELLRRTLIYAIERKKTEEDILKLSEDMAARNVELEEANRELEAFIYSVSHDLRAPLRSMSGFARFLIEDYSDKVDNRGKDYLSRIQTGSEKMSRLIDDLLHLSKISRQEIVLIEVDMSRLASAVVSDLREAEPVRNVAVSIREGLVANADLRLMEIVLSNLLGNAWKFTSKTEDARIEFGSLEGTVPDFSPPSAERTERSGVVESGLSQLGRTVYFVRDNGAGFDPHYVEKIFWPFQRLHSEKEFEGSGIGLAIVERIIHRHGGKVWADGAPGKGATVYFTLG